MRHVCPLPNTDSSSSEFIDTGKLPVIDPQNDVLWQSIDAFDFNDPDADSSFTARLAREIGWKPDYASRMVEEYKRFVYLGIRAGHEVTPSDAVDQAWHLHLTYSQNYWDKICKDVLEMPLQHGATKGGKPEAEKYWEQYHRTLDSYQELSGESPPVDIWPSPRDRFVDVSAICRVNAAQNWVIRKPTIQKFPLASIGRGHCAGHCWPLGGAVRRGVLAALSWRGRSGFLRGDTGKVVI